MTRRDADMPETYAPQNNAVNDASAVSGAREGATIVASETETGTTTPTDASNQRHRAAVIGRLFPRASIRTRLLIIFMGLTLLPITLTIIASHTRFSQSTQEHLIAQFESVVTLKEAEIQTWLDGLKSDLVLLSINESDGEGIRELLQKDVLPEARATSHERLKRSFQEIIQQTERFEELFVVDAEGKIILSTDSTQEGKSYSDAPLFQEGWKETFVQPASYATHLDKFTIVVAQPLYNRWGEAVGILSGRVNLDPLNEIMHEKAGLGETGETYLVGSDRVLLTPLRSGSYVLGQTRINTEGVDIVLTTQRYESGTFDNYRGVSVIGVYRWLPELKAALLAEQAQSEAFRTTTTVLLGNVVVSLAAVLAAFGAGLLITRSIARPLAELAVTATRISEGNLQLQAHANRQDEIGTLAQAFNRMTSQVRGLIEGLEDRVTARTQDLERRTTYLEASAEVARAASSILDRDQLIAEVVEIIRDQFDLYYVGLFLKDEASEWAVLRAGTGEAGRAMLARGHRIRIGEGMIGWSIANAKARVALDVSIDAVRIITSELSFTRSEAAIPLRSRGQVLGALTVQHTQPNAFGHMAVAALQTMADQVAIALDNARLLAESQAALDAERRAFSELSRRAWIELARERPSLGFRCDERGVTAISNNALRISETDGVAQIDQTDYDHLFERDLGIPVSVPIKVRDNVIGVLETYKPHASGTWSQEELELLEHLVEQMGLALEGARLHEEAQRRAQREHLTREIAEKVRSAPDIESIALTAAEALAQALGGARGFVKLDPAALLDEDGHDDTSPS